MRYADRAAAGQALAKHLAHLAGRSDVVVLGLPRGGVPVAAEIAEQLKIPLDVLVVRKLGVPWHRELAMGAIAPGGVRILQDRVIRTVGVSEQQIDEASQRETAELERQERVFRGSRPALAIEGKTAVLVDDGLATGASMLAAVRAAKALGAARVIAAAPVGAPDTIKRLREEADEVAVDQTPRGFGAVGQWYDNFRQVSDDEVLAALARSP